MKTSVLANATYMQNAQRELFNVFGVIMVHQLYFEVTTVFAAGATVLQFNYTSSTPAWGPDPMSGDCASLANLAQGFRCVWIGGAVASLPTITATEGLSDVINVNPQIIGNDNGVTQGVGTIGKLDATAVNASGACQYHIHYTPMSDGAYCSAVL